MEDIYCTYRLDLSEDEYENLIKLLGDKPSEYGYISLNEKLHNPKKIKYSGKKAMAAEKATDVRTQRAKEKMQNAINILRMENKKITVYSIAKTANISYSTVKKYIDLFQID